MKIAPINFMSINNNYAMMPIRNVQPVEPVEKVTPKATQKPEEKLDTEGYKTSFRGAEALANYNKTFLVSKPLRNNKFNIKQEDTKTDSKPIEVNTPSFKAEEGIENLTAQN